MNGIWDQNFFLSFSANLIPYWLKIIPEIGYLVFWIFLLFFSEFSCSGRVGTEFGTKFFSLFVGLSHPVSAKNNAGKKFFSLLNFCYFFRNFLSRVEYERNLGLNFFLLFHVLYHPVVARNNAGNRFLKFLTFFAIFFGIFLPGSSMNGICD